ncbi:hypothetical protein HN51_054516 [Arachis hypogaea]|uniref:Auxin-induced protein n=2 Tax=Arachis TaxID=3817 RepID=A0A444XIQ9_ARAHY|nr:Auxin-responsive protein [Arachis hypogaea]RYQ89557.1 hypothetical protein Ahy_B09g096135 isoform A [Arachis hypogaea]
MDEEAYSSSSSSSPVNPSFSIASSKSDKFYVKVYMEGNPIGRKLNLLAHDSYRGLVKALEHMFKTTILLATELDAVQAERCHVLTYEDGERDLIMVRNVSWE